MCASILVKTKSTDKLLKWLNLVRDKNEAHNDLRTTLVHQHSANRITYAPNLSSNLKVPSLAGIANSHTESACMHRELTQLMPLYLPGYAVFHIRI